MGIFATAGPNEALVLSGLFKRRLTIRRGGRLIVLPFVQKLQRLSLNVMTLNIESPRIYTKLGVPISVTGVAQVKVKTDNDEDIRKASQLFLGKAEHQVRQVVLETLEGHQRAIMGTMTVEEIYQDRQKFSHAVYLVAQKDLQQLGMDVVSYTIQSVSDEHGYLQALGVKRTCEVQRDAKIGQAEAQRDAGIREALARQNQKAAEFENSTEIEKAKRDYELKKADYDIEVKTQQATADLATQLQIAKTQQRIRNEEMGVKLIERQKQIQVMEQEIIRRERELEASVKQPAKAEKYKLETLAEANKNRAILEAQARAEAIRAKGQADAFAINAKAQAEAEAMKKKADAWSEYKDAAMLDMLLKTLPRVAAEIAAPLSKAEKITMVAGPNGELGVGKLTGEILDLMASIPESVNKMTGVDINKVMKVSTI